MPYVVIPNKQSPFLFSRYRRVVYYFVICATLTVGVLISNVYTTYQFRDDALTINVAGRQRMLSQRIIKDILLIQADRSQNKDYEASTAELKLSCFLFENTLNSLETGGTVFNADNQPKNIAPVTDPACLVALAHGKELWKPFKATLAPFLEDGSVVSKDLASAATAITSQSTNLFNAMTRLIISIQTQSENRVEHVLETQTLALVLIFVTSIFITKEFLSNIRKSDIELASKNEALEQAILSLRQSLKDTNDIKAALNEHAIVSTTDPAGKITSVNDKFCEISKYSREELLGQDHRIINSGLHSREFFSDLWKTLSKGRVWKGEIKNRAKDGSHYWVKSSIVPILNQSGCSVQYVSIREDITERKTAEDTLKVSEERFRQAFHYSAIGFALVGLDGSWKAMNPALLKIVGYSGEELLTMTFQNITHPDDLEADLEHVRKLIAGEGTHYQMEKRYLHKTGRIVWVLLTVSIVNHPDGKPAYFISQIQDVTQRHESELLIKAALEEKEVLLREVHHRVKNNMQVICSLLQLQLSYIHDELDRDIFKECQMRIRSMALVHERLYRSSSLATIDFAEYLEDLSALVFQSQLNRKTTVKLVKDYESVELGLDTAILLGLIANELISNALKHAFRDRMNGTLTVRLKKQPSDVLLFEIEDDGVGLPKDLDTHTKKSLGMRLISNLGRQLRAKVEFTNRENGGASIQFLLALSSNP